MLYDAIQGDWTTKVDFWRAEMCTDSAYLSHNYHPSRFWELHIQTRWDFQPMLYDAIQGNWTTQADFLGAAICTDNAYQHNYHPSRYWEPYIQTGWDFQPMLYNAIQRVWTTPADFWEAVVCTDRTPTSILPPMQILGTTDPNLLKLSIHVRWCHIGWLDHPSRFLEG